MSRASLIRIYGLDEVRRREKAYSAQYRKGVLPIRDWDRGELITSRLVREGYSMAEASKVFVWLRDGWKKEPLPPSLCKCHGHYLCNVHYLDKLMECVK